MTGRAAGGPLLVRAGVLLASAVALLLAAPPPVLGPPLGLAGLVGLAAVPAVAPRGPVPTLAMLVTVAGWVLATEAYDRPVTPVRVLLLAGLLYLVHSLSGLAATLPLDAVVAPEVVLQWLGRSLAVVLAGAALSVVTLAGLTGLPGGRYVAATLAGLALATGLAAGLAWSARRARPAEPPDLPARPDPVDSELGVGLRTLSRTASHDHGGRAIMEE